MIVKCNWKTCINCKKGICNRAAINLISFDYEENNEEECQGLMCNEYKYNPLWMDKGYSVDQ